MNTSKENTNFVPPRSKLPYKICHSKAHFQKHGWFIINVRKVAPLMLAVGYFCKSRNSITLVRPIILLPDLLIWQWRAKFWGLVSLVHWTYKPCHPNHSSNGKFNIKLILLIITLIKLKSTSLNQNYWSCLNQKKKSVLKSHLKI
jgi:hypothetical protein